MSKKKGIIALIEKIGNWIGDLFNQIAKAWKKQSPELRAGIERASAIIAIINEHAKEAPQAVWLKIQGMFPDITEERFVGILEVIQAELNRTGTLIVEDDPMLTLQHIMNYLRGLKSKEGGTEWADTSHKLYLAIARETTPKGTKLITILQFASWVYHTFFKGKV